MVNFLTTLVALVASSSLVAAAPANEARAVTKFRLQVINNTGGKYNNYWVTPATGAASTLALNVVSNQSSAPKNFYFTNDMRLEYAVSSTVSKGLVFQSVSGSSTYAVPAQVTPAAGTLAMVDDELFGLIWNNSAKFNGWLVCPVSGGQALFWEYRPNAAAKAPAGCVSVRLVENYA